MDPLSGFLLADVYTRDVTLEVNLEQQISEGQGQPWLSAALLFLVPDIRKVEAWRSLWLINWDSGGS